MTIRLLDPPLHEFLPSLAELEERVAQSSAAGDGEVEAHERDFARVRGLQEVNPQPPSYRPAG